MTDMTYVKPSLGVGTIIGDAFGVVFQRFVPIFMAAFLPLALASAITAALFGAAFSAGAEDAVPSVIAIVVNWVLGLLASGLSTAMIVHIVYGIRTGRSVPLGAAFQAALRWIVPISVLSVVAGALIAAGLMMLIVPGLYLWALWAVVVPAIVVEGAGYGGLGRSAELTREYRWPIVGLLVVFGLILIVVGLAMSAVAAIVAASLGGIAALALTTLVNAVPYTLIAAMTALLYARLREIKDGVGVDSIVEVFA